MELRNDIVVSISKEHEVKPQIDVTTCVKNKMDFKDDVEVYNPAQDYDFQQVPGIPTKQVLMTRSSKKEHEKIIEDEIAKARSAANRAAAGEFARQKVKEELEMRVPSICLSNGKVCIQLSMDEYGLLQAKELIPATFVSATVYKTSFPHKKKALALIFNENGEEKRIIYELDEDVAYATKFVNKLRASGISLKVSRKKKTDIAEAMLQFFIDMACEIELPYKVGYFLRGDGSIGLARVNDLTFLEVMENE